MQKKRIVVTEDKLKTLILNYIDKNFSNKVIAAKHWGIGATWLSDIIACRRPPSHKIMEDLGIERDKSRRYFRV